MKGIIKYLKVAFCKHDYNWESDGLLFHLKCNKCGRIIRP